MNHSELSHMAGAVDDSTINIVVVIIIIIIARAFSGTLQVAAARLRHADLEESLRMESMWRRDAESESRQRRHQNDDLIAAIGEQRQQAERRYADLEDRALTQLTNAKKRT